MVSKSGGENRSHPTQPPKGYENLAHGQVQRFSEAGGGVLSAMVFQSPFDFKHRFPETLQFTVVKQNDNVQLACLP